MTSIRDLAVKVLQSRQTTRCFMFHALEDETVKHGAKTVQDQRDEVFHRSMSNETLWQEEKPCVSGVSRPETGVKQQQPVPIVPGAYRPGLEHLSASCPAGVPDDRWRLALADAERFLAEWGDTAERLGWT